MYLNLNAPSNYQLQGFGQNGVRTISTDQLYIQGEYYRVLVAEEDSYVTAVSVLGDDLTAEFVYAGTTIYGLFTEVSVTSGSLTAYIAGPTDIEDVWAYINAYGEANAARIEAADCAKDAIAPLLDKYYAKASLVMVPSLYKTSIVYSERPLTTAGQLAFTRSNDTATRVGPDGYIEKVRTNLLLQSNSFSTTWTNDNTTETSGQSGYDGTNNAWLLNATAASGSIIQSVSVASVQTFSVYAKAGTYGFIRVQINGTGFDKRIDVNLANGTIGTAGGGNLRASTTSIGSGWWRIQLAADTTSTAVRFYPIVADNDLSGTSGNILIQAAQLETGDIATNYIPTTTAAVSVGPVANLPRLNYPINSDGSVGCPSLLLEPQRTNLLTYSEQFDNAAWTKVAVGTGVAPVVTANSVISPDGDENAETIVFNAGAGTTSTDQSLINQTIATTSGQSYTFNVYLKGSVGGEKIVIRKPNNDYVAVTLTTEWQRFSVTEAAAGASHAAQFGLRQNLSGIGTINSTATIYAYGAALELGTYPTSYIPTLGAAVTRGIERFNKTGISSLINSQEGTFFVEMATFSDNVGTRILSLSDGSVNNNLYIGYTPTTNQISAVFSSGGTAQAIFNTTAFNITEQNKIAVSYKTNEVKMYVNGTLIGTDTSATMPAAGTLSQLKSDFGQGSFPLEASIKQAIIFPTALSDAEAIALTTL
jgi:hypothetical protein